MHAQGALSGEHDWTQVQGFFTAGRWHPCRIGVHQQADCLKEGLLGQLRHCNAVSRALEATSVLLRAESNNGAIRHAICLQALKNCLPVMQDRRRRLHLNRTVCLQLGVMPALVCGPVNSDHVVGEVLTKTRVGQNLLTLGIREWIRVTFDCKFQSRHVFHPKPSRIESYQYSPRKTVLVRQMSASQALGAGTFQ